MTDPIRLGLMPPLTGSVNFYGAEIVHAARIACAEINAGGGVLGRPLELFIEDDGSAPNTAVAAARRLIDEHRCRAIIGNLLSNARIAVAAQVAEAKRIPYLNFSFYEGSIAGRYFFHFAALPNQQIETMIPAMARRFGLKMFFAGRNFEWARGSIDAGKRALSQLGGDIVGEEYLANTGRDLIDRLLNRLERSGADVFVPFFTGDEQVALLTRFTEMQLKKRMAVVMLRYDEVIASRLPPSVRDGFYSSNSYFMSLATDANRTYLQRLAGEPGIEGIWPNGNGVLTNFGEGAYLCVHAFAKACDAAASTDAEALVDALKTVSVSGPQGRVDMDPATQHARVNTYLARCNSDGTFSIVEAFGCNRPRIPERYLEPSAPARRHESPPAAQHADSTAGRSGVRGTSSGTAEQMLSLAHAAIVATDCRGLIREASHRACQMFGYGDDELTGLSVHLLLAPSFRQRHVELLQQFVDGQLGEHALSDGEEMLGYRQDGSIFPLDASIARSPAGEECLLVLTLRDASEDSKSRDNLARAMTHDALTGLPKRALIGERIVSALQRSRRSGLSVALLFVDLDGFKQLNGNYGRDVGKLLLKAVASRLIEQVRPGDTVARFSGDEFVVFCEQVKQPTAMSILAERINVALRRPFDLAGLTLFVTASVGVAIGHGATHSAADLLRHADAAVSAAKGRGRDGWQFFSADLQLQAEQRLVISNGLRTAIARDELSACFQPIVAAENGRIVGAELLLRWNPAAGAVSPAAFIPIAEATGAIVPIGAWVFERACRAQADWARRWGDDAPYVSVNVSVRQLNEESLADDFAAIVRTTGADPTRLSIEITETALMADVESNLRILRRLTDLGLRIAVDDFGTGYSSLAQLTRLPVSVLKIDQAFVAGIEKSPESRTVVRAVIGLGRALGLKLVAEGVENQFQQRELCAYGCDFIQGYYFHRPLQARDFIETVEHESRSNPSRAVSSLYFLIYVSAVVPSMSALEITELLGKSRIFNRSVGLTGCLIHHDGCFMQMLEGEQGAIAELMERIKVDPRHRDVRVVIEGQTRHRVFTDWGMVFRDLASHVDAPDFGPWQRRSISFLELGDDARSCYQFITAYAQGGALSI